MTETKDRGTYPNYWNFIRGKDTNNPVYGINPEAMGGKVRTEGFHAPMSDYQQFVYTFTLPVDDNYADCSWQVEVDEDYKDKLLFWDGDASTPGEGSTSLRPKGTGMTGQTFTFTNDLLALQEGGDIKKDAIDSQYVELTLEIHHIKRTERIGLKRNSPSRPIPFRPCDDMSPDTERNSSVLICLRHDRTQDYLLL